MVKILTASRQVLDKGAKAPREALQKESQDKAGYFQNHHRREKC